MTNKKFSFRQFISNLNDPDFEGGFYLPNIQRKFVWSEEQIAKLYDSILREYPIGGNSNKNLPVIPVNTYH
jgi:uncharacterized protein with ParB-like and HNH nuclease domain